MNKFIMTALMSVTFMSLINCQQSLNIHIGVANLLTLGNTDNQVNIEGMSITTFLGDITPTYGVEVFLYTQKHISKKSFINLSTSIGLERLKINNEKSLDFIFDINNPIFIYHKNVSINRLAAKLHLHYGFFLGKNHRVSLALGFLANQRLMDLSILHLTSEQRTQVRLSTTTGELQTTTLRNPIFTKNRLKLESQASSFQYGCSFLASWRPKKKLTKLNLGLRLDRYLSDFSIKTGYKLTWDTALFLSWRIK